MQHFAVVAMARSGSTRLCDILGRHPLVACHQEIFYPGEVQAHLPKTLGLKVLDRDFRDADPQAFLDEFLRLNEAWFKDRLWHGFKTIMGAHQMPATLLVCGDKRIRKLLLRRDNLVAAYASHRLGSEAGVWQRVDGDGQAATDHKVQFDRRQFQSFCGQNLVIWDACERALRQSRQTYLTVEYEETLTPQGMDRIWTYLGVAAIAEQGIFRRTNTRPLLDCFVNPDEAAEAVHQLGRPDWLRDAAGAKAQSQAGRSGAARSYFY